MRVITVIAYGYRKRLPKEPVMSLKHPFFETAQTESQAGNISAGCTNITGKRPPLMPWSVGQKTSKPAKDVKALKNSVPLSAMRASAVRLILGSLNRRAFVSEGQGQRHTC